MRDKRQLVTLVADNDDRHTAAPIIDGSTDEAANRDRNA